MTTGCQNLLCPKKQKAHKHHCLQAYLPAHSRTRTGDLLITNELRYQLRYISKKWTIQVHSMTDPGIEPGFTPWEGVVLTAWPIGLSTLTLKISRRQDSNLRPQRPERCAPPNWATPRYLCKYRIIFWICQPFLKTFLSKNRILKNAINLHF